MPYISTQETAEKRKALKAALPNYKLSVRKDGYSQIIVTILEGPIQLLKDGEEYTHVNHYYFEEHYKDSPETVKVLKTIYDIISKEQKESYYDVDYGSVPNYYISMNIGQWDKPYKVK